MQSCLSSGGGRDLRGLCVPPCPWQRSAAGSAAFCGSPGRAAECESPVGKRRCHRAGPGEHSKSFGKGSFVSAPAEITELRESPACLRPLCCCSLECSVGLRVSPWEKNSQIASVVGRKIASPSVYQLMYTLLLVGLNRNNFITEVHFFKCSCPCWVNPFSKSSLSLIFSLINTGYQFLHLITAQSCKSSLQ